MSEYKYDIIEVNPESIIGRLRLKWLHWRGWGIMDAYYEDENSDIVTSLIRKQLPDRTADDHNRPF